MNQRLITISVFVFLMITACSYIPKEPIFLNEKENLSKFSAEYGVLAFEPDTGIENLEISLDIRNTGTKDLYRISLTPPLRLYKVVSVFGKVVRSEEVETDNITKTIALFGLPAGTYLPEFLHIRKEQSSGNISATGDQIDIEKNSITYLGLFKIAYETNILGVANSASVFFDGATGVNEISSVASDEIQKMKVIERNVKFTGH
ncbi:MAG TPA: hypothetical protein VLM37_07020 [Fibrobacteraceae bacterium]|nr:hypothetical protein [Fibrobacteraceae bacterium]